MKKLLLALIFIFIFIFIFTTTVGAMTLTWDVYSDPVATNLRIYHSMDNTNWTAILIDDIPTNNIASEIPDGNDNERVYYRMTANDSVNSEESTPSNTVSFYWTTGGSGHTGPAGIGGLRLLDCNPFDLITDDGSNDWDLCNNRYNK